MRFYYLLMGKKTNNKMSLIYLYSVIEWSNNWELQINVLLYRPCQITTSKLIIFVENMHWTRWFKIILWNFTHENSTLMFKQFFLIENKLSLSLSLFLYIYIYNIHSIIRILGDQTKNSFYRVLRFTECSNNQGEKINLN